MQLASYIDHTTLKNVTTSADIDLLCQEALDHGFAAVCVPPYFVQDAARLLVNSKVKTATVIGFPFGYHHYKTKVAEARQALEDGADELDMVMNIGAFKSNDLAYVEAEAEAMSRLTAANNKVLKIIIESGVLTEEEIIACCKLYKHYPVQFLKTSTGFGGEGASIAVVELMRKHLPPEIKIKASGGIRTKDFALKLIAAGADRLGCSAGVQIIKGESTGSSY